MPNIRVAAVEAFPLTIPLPRDQWFGDSRGVRVTSRGMTLVKVTTSDGLWGWGECSGPPLVTAALVRDLAKGVVGTRLGQTEQVLTRSLWSDYHSGTGHHIAALSGIDVALWDAWARTLGVQVAELLGGPSRLQVPAYASTGYLRAQGDDLEHLESDITEAVGAGFRAVKIKAGLSPALDRRRAEAARAALGDERALMVDFNGAYPADIARRSIEGLREYEPTWVEEPVAPEDHLGHALLRPLGVSLAAGEALHTRFGFRDVIAQGRVDVVQPGLTRAGGFSEVRAVTAMARAWCRRVSLHVWGGAVGLAAAVHFLAALPEYETGSAFAQAARLELDRSPNPLRDALLVTPLEFSDGHVLLPSGTGLGIDVAPEALREFAAEQR